MRSDSIKHCDSNKHGVMFYLLFCWTPVIDSKDYEGKRVRASVKCCAINSVIKVDMPEKILTFSQGLFIFFVKLEKTTTADSFIAR